MVSCDTRPICCVLLLCCNAILVMLYLFIVLLCCVVVLFHFVMLDFTIVSYFVLLHCFVANGLLSGLIFVLQLSLM